MIQATYRRAPIPCGDGVAEPDLVLMPEPCAIPDCLTEATEWGEVCLNAHAIETQGAAPLVIEYALCLRHAAIGMTDSLVCDEECGEVEE